MESKEKLFKAWELLGDIPINDNGEIDIPFLHFEVGVDREEIWHWFEAQNPEFSVAKAMGIH